jgi:hypothetical protein
MNTEMKMKRMRSLLKLAALTVVLLGSSVARAQFNASLSGTVLDPTKAVIPNATVTLTDDATQTAKTTTSSGDGTYQFNELPPGTYTLKITVKGFQDNTISNVSLAAETPRNVDVTMQAAGSTQQVTVNANQVSLLQTADASVGGTLSEQQIQDLPSSGGDPYELLRTTVGITGNGARSGAGTSVFLPNGAGPGQSNTGIFQVENQVQISAAGQSVGANDYTIDGVSVNSLGQAGAAVVTPNEDSIAQMTVLSASYSAEDGRDSGAHIKVVSKSGTNSLHGSLYFRYDEPGLNAFNHSVESIPSVKVENQVRDYRASVGGPILKNKLFLFSSFEGFNTKNDNYVNQWVETPQFDAALLASRANTVSAKIVGSGGVTPRINGLLPPTCSYYQSQTDPNIPVPPGAPPASDPCQIVGTGIDVGSPGLASANGTYATDYNVGAGLDGVPDLEYAQLVEPNHSHGNQFNGRVDWYATSRDQLAVSTYITKLDGDGPSSSNGSRPQGDVPTKPLNSTGTFIFIHTLSPSLVNEFRSNFTRYFDNQVVDGAGSINYGIPWINIQNLPVNAINYGVAWGSTSPGIFAENTYEVRDMVIKSIGSNSLRVGGEYRWEQDNNNLGGESRPGYSVQGLWNFFNNAPIYEEIEANPLTGGPANTARYLRSQTLGLFAQDDWKITPTFTVNLGLRYEYFSPFRNKGEEINLPVLGAAPNQLITPSLTPHNNFFNPDHTGAEPKFGFAWTPAVFNGKTVIRGGVGRALNRLNFSELDNAVEDGPGVFSYGLCCGGNGNTAGIVYEIGSGNSPTSYGPNPALKTAIVNGLPVTSTGAAIGIEVYGALPVTKIPYAYLYSLEIQHQFPAGIVLTLGYQGSEAHHLPRLVNQNFLYSQPSGGAQQIFNAAYFLQTDSNSNYNALNLHAAKQLQHGFQIDAIYTYAKSLDQISNGFGADSLANQTNPAQNYTEWGPSDYDVRHRVTVNGLWRIPGTRNGNEVVKTLTNGWQITGIFTFYTGFPFTPVSYNQASNPFVTNAATITPTRPYAYYGGFVASCSNQNYISGADVANTSFLLNAPAGQTYRPGIGRNSFQGPCYKDTDMSFAREQKFTVRDHTITARFQANLFNIFNQDDLLPFQNGNAGGPAQIVDAQPDKVVGGTTRATSSYGKPTGTDAGRVVEFFAHIQF